VSCFVTIEIIWYVTSRLINGRGISRRLLPRRMSYGKNLSLTCLQMLRFSQVRFCEDIFSGIELCGNSFPRRTRHRDSAAV